MNKFFYSVSIKIGNKKSLPGFTMAGISKYVNLIDCRGINNHPFRPYPGHRHHDALLQALVCLQLHTLLLTT